MSTENFSSLFGKVSLGYLYIEASDLDAWAKFGELGLGMHLADRSESSIAFRIDTHQKRMIVGKGQADDVLAVGWQLADEDSLNIIRQRLALRGILMQPGNHSDAVLRGVEEFWYFTGPKRQRIEVFCEALQTSEPLKMLNQGFVTGASGMGHVAITTREPVAMQEFWQEIFDARLSDHIEEKIGGVNLDICFLRLNQRHHSVAIASTRGLKMNPIKHKVQHFNLEAAQLEDVLSAYVRCQQLGYRIALSVGQHTNDKELSFYVISPSGFEIELGWNPIVISDEVAWQTSVHQGISIWGHSPKGQTVADKLSQLKLGVSSLFKEEYTALDGYKE